MARGVVVVGLGSNPDGAQLARLSCRSGRGFEP